jgi:hypothetical protein
MGNGNFASYAGSIDSLSPESSPLRASSMSLGSASSLRLKRSEKANAAKPK